ncbi:hypothetical protein JCM24511_07805 [Saitozyma sp. JCM 24511]|nr:hypothetical protein JCM24511_07805 [Saitozyma sp. JCM 24511]
MSSSASTSDPLLLLRQSISLSLPAELLTASSDPSPSLALATHLSFPQPSGDPISIPKDAPTRYTSKPDSRDEFYTLGQVWLAWTERDTGVREYLMRGQAGGVGYVGIADRKGVVDYLKGESEGECGRDRERGRAGANARASYEASQLVPRAAPVPSAASATVEALSTALESTAEAGPSKVAPVKRKYEVDVADREFCKKLRAEEIELRDRNSVLRTAGGGKVHDFYPWVQTVMVEKIRALRNSFSSSGSKQAAPASQPAYDPSRGAKKAKSTNPIIMISSSPTSLITMWNVKKFLEQGIFEPSEVARQNEAAQGNVRSEDMIPVLRKRSGPNGEVTSKYYVVDGVEALQKFGQDAWDRVICVVTTGQAWQFKPYKWQDPKVLFRNVKGIYFQWSNEPTNPVIRDWNVTQMRVDRAKRHTDRQVVADFWRMLDGVKRR